MSQMKVSPLLRCIGSMRQVLYVINSYQNQVYNMFIPSGPQPELVPIAVSAQNFDVGKFSDVVFPW